MRFRTEVHEAQIPQLLNDLIAIVGREPWVRRFEWLAQELRENDHMRDWLLERCQIEWNLREAIANRELSGGVPYRSELLGRYELIAFAAGVTQMYARLSTNGQRRLRGSLLDGLKSDKGLLSLQHEVSTAVHLMQCGFDIEFNDLENGGGVDFIAAKEDIAIEVECKMFSGDIGRRIHRRAQARLFGRMRGRLMQALEVLKTGLIVRITLPVRLSNSEAQHEQICQTVERGLLSGHVFHGEECIVSVLDFEVESSPFRSFEQENFDLVAGRNFVVDLTGNRNPSLAMLVSQNGQVLVVVFESAKDDDVIGGIRRQLRDAAADQFTGKKPGVLMAQLLDLSNDQLFELVRSDSSDRSKASRLQVMTSDLLQASSRQHVHSVVYRGVPSVVSQEGAVGVQGVTYFMRNEFHPLARDPRLSLGQPYVT